MSFEQFGDVLIFRPSHEIENVIREQSRAHLLSRFAPGEYRGAKAANEVIQHQFQYYDRLLRPLILQLASRDAAEFLLFQYDEASRILHGRGILDLRERENWMWIEPRLKRAIKFLVELICMTVSGSRPVQNRGQARLVMETALACAESMVDLVQMSDLAYSIFPNDCVVRVFDIGLKAFEIKIEGAFAGYDRTFSDRVIRDRESRQRFTGIPQFDNHTATHQRYLDAAFSQSFGMSYGMFIAGLIAVIDDCQPSLHPNAFPTLFIHRDAVIDQLAKSGQPRTAIETFLDGFSITPAKLIAEQRAIWKPKQENRAHRRGFYVLPHESGPHLAFSRAMARENLLQLVNWVSYKRLPVEWKTPATQKALADLSHGASGWFEDVVCRNLKELGIFGQRIHRTLGSGQSLLRIPESVGEIDFLGYHPQQKLLVLVEAKMVMTGLEARYWRDDLDEFVVRPGSYAERFRRKISWAQENAARISSISGFGPVRGIGIAMLTLYPCIARALIPDFPCISITEFMLDYERESQWPYALTSAAGC